jgi:hypothetical protein
MSRPDHRFRRAGQCNKDSVIQSIPAKGAGKSLYRIGGSFGDVSRRISRVRRTLTRHFPLGFRWNQPKWDGMPDTPSQASQITAKEKLTVLLAEYATLRAEIIQRYNSGFQLLAISVPSLVLINSVSGLAKWYIPALAIAAIAIAAYIILTGIHRISIHLQSLESRINTLAEDELMSWETRIQIVRGKSISYEWALCSKWLRKLLPPKH